MAVIMTALLLSGGMDSTAIAYWKRPSVGITIHYGQRPAPGEIRASSAICSALNIEHFVISANIAALGSGDLVGHPPSDGAPASEWWPYRNQFLISLAAMKCHQLCISELMIGALKTDGFHADGTREFIDRINDLLALQEGNLRVSAPAIGLTASELVRQSEIPEELLCWSHSCHVAESACGFCRGCRKHFETMESCFGHAY